MAIPFRRTGGGSASPDCAYIAMFERSSMIYGGLLVTDVAGLPKEFVYNRVSTPAGVLWPGDEVRKMASLSLAHSLFDACERNPSLLLGSFRLQEAGFAPVAFAVSVPFGLVDEGAIAWVGLEPSAGHPATAAAKELAARKLLEEPFARIVKALEEVYSLT